MSSLIPFDFFLLRSPLLSFDDGIGLIHPEKLKAICSDYVENEDPLFELVRTALRYSSPDFFERAQKKYDLKAESTLTRFILRMSSRSTPFGLLAGYSVGKPGASTEVKFKDKSDWIVRYTASGQETLKGLYQQTVNSVSSFGPHPTLSLDKTTLKVMKRSFREDFSTEEIKELKIKLNASGTDQLKTLLKKSQIKPTKNAFFQELRNHKILVPSIPYDGYLKGSWKNIRFKELNKTSELKSANIILNKTVEVCTLNQKDSSRIAKAVEILMRLFSRQLYVYQKNRPIGKFVQTMESKFPGRELSLIEALDPIKGVIDPEDFARYGTEPINQDFSELSKFFNDKIFSKAQRLEEWDLSEKDLESIEAIDQKGTYRKAKLPSAISVMADIHQDGKLFIKSVMGTPGHQFISRFAAADEELLGSTRAIQEWNDKQNENVIFAEIVEWPEKKNMATFGTRRILTDYIIPLDYTHSEWPQEKQILLNDLFVSINYGRVRLRSKKMNIEIIPILSTAYNFVYDKNPFLRFLASVANQDNFNYLGWMWGGLRSLPYLPRIKYKNIILSARQWRLSKEVVASVTLSSDKLSSFRKIASELGLPKTFNWVFLNDQRLYVDLQNDLMLTTFLEALCGNESLQVNYLEEFLGNESFEYLVPFKNLAKPRQDPYSHLHREQTNRSSLFHLGDSCLYFKLYTNTLNFDDLLQTDISLFIKKIKKAYQIESWFFVKYADPSPHLRIRLFLKNKSDWAQLIKELNTFERALFKDNKIWNFQMETYKRDFDGNEKDQWTRFNQVSQLDSERVLTELNKLNFSQWSLDQKRLFTIELAHNYLLLKYPDLNERIEATKLLRQAYHTMGLETPDEIKDEFLSLWRNRKTEIVKGVSNNQDSYFRTYFAKIKTIYGKQMAIYNPQRLFHMSLNRLLTGIKYYEEDQVYGLLYKVYIELKHRGQS